jgi:hypothetical protein
MVAKDDHSVSWFIIICACQLLIQAFQPPFLSHTNKGAFYVFINNIGVENVCIFKKAKRHFDIYFDGSSYAKFLWVGLVTKRGV